MVGYAECQLTCGGESCRECDAVELRRTLSGFVSLVIVQ